MRWPCSSAVSMNFAVASFFMSATASPGWYRRRSTWGASSAYLLLAFIEGAGARGSCCCCCVGNAVGVNRYALAAERPSASRCMRAMCWSEGKEKKRLAASRKKSEV